MVRTILIVLGCSLAAPGQAAFAQANPTEAGPLGTPMTPQQMGAWVEAPGLSEAQAEYDARAQGYRPAQPMHEDSYGDWIGRSGKGDVIVFPDGTASPL
jgi:hypothetical protein